MLSLVMQTEKIVKNSLSKFDESNSLKRYTASGIINFGKWLLDCEV